VTGNAWSVTVPPSQGLVAGPYTVAATVSDGAGNPATANAGLLVDAPPPTIAITGIDNGGEVNAADAAAGFLVTGTTTNVEDGQVVTLSFLDATNTVVHTENAMVIDGAWSVTVPAADHLADGQYTLAADVSNQQGTPAPEATQSFVVDETPPQISVDPIAPVGAGAAQTGIILSGTTDAEDGQDVTVSVRDGSGAQLESVQTPVANGAWTTTIPGILPDGVYSVTAEVLDIAGNDSVSLAVPMVVEETAPTLTVSAPTVVNAADPPVLSVSGTSSAEDGQEVTVQLVDASNNPVGIAGTAPVIGGS
jgi:hypothetical protein